MLKSLFGVLIRFRKGEIGFVGDIKEMFHRVNISESDRWSQCFLWRDDPTKEIEIYRMRAMIFGAASSPFIAQFVKNFNAMKHQGEYPDAADAIINQHYVDDFLGSSNTKEEAVRLIHDVIKVHAQGGFHITNFSSNSKDEISEIPEEMVAENSKLMLNDENNVQRVLGLLWNATSDEFTFSVNLNKINPVLISGGRYPTKREVLSVVMSVFDPLGFITPITIMGRILLQDIWRAGLGWDDELTQKLKEKWKLWLETLHQINDVQIPRCFSPKLKTASRV